MSTTIVSVLDGGPHEPTADEQVFIDRFVAAFLAKKNGPPAGHWRVPGVGMCVFYLKP